MKTVLLNTGRAALEAAVSTKIKLGSFIFGANFGFALDPAANVVQGLQVATGLKQNIKYHVVSPDLIHFIVNLPHSYDTARFEWGNVMLFTESAIPLLHGVTETLQLKTATLDDNRGIALQVYFPLEYEGLLNKIDLTELTPLDSDPYVVDYLENLDTVAYDKTQVIINNTRNASSTFAFRDNKRGEWWGAPYYQSKSDPLLGCVNGGIVGEAFQIRVPHYSYDYHYATGYCTDNLVKVTTTPNGD